MSSFSDPAALSEALGPHSAVARAAAECLAALYQESESLPPVANSFRAWAASQPSDGQNSPDDFIRHTCLSLLCRLMAYRFLEPLPSERDLWDVISGDYFVGAGLGNFLGEDFFSWPYFRRSMGIGDDQEGMDAARKLLSALQAFDFATPPPGLLSLLYLAYRGEDGISEEEAIPFGMRELADNPYLTFIAPRCGDGNALARCVSAAVDGRQARGEHPMEALLGVSGQFLSMTSDPLAYVVASVAFLVSLGEPAMEPHPPILIPVYMADFTRVPERRLETSGQRSYVIDAADGITLPEQVAADPLYLDWLLSRLPNYQRGAALRLRAQPEDLAVQEVLNAWYNYLTSPKARTPIPEPLTPAAADVMVEAARALIVAYVHGSGPALLHLARNAPAPLFGARRKFDLTI